jgi:GNAT superfamily N-acetyltransferase
MNSFLYDECSLCEVLERKDILGFKCGDADLDDFFSNDCFDYARQLLGKTYCYRLKSNFQEVVCAFTLANAGIRVSDLPNARRKRVEENIPHVKALKDYPAVLVARLGVSVKYHSKHVGSDVLEYIKYWFLEPRNKTGCRYVLVDAYNSNDTISFYEHNGFKTVFSNEQQEKEYRHISENISLKTRLMYFDLMLAVDR